MAALVVPSPKLHRTDVIAEVPATEVLVKSTSRGRFPVKGKAEKLAVGPVLGLVTESFLAHPAGIRIAKAVAARSASGARRGCILPSILPHFGPRLAEKARPSRGPLSHYGDLTSRLWSILGLRPLRGGAGRLLRFGDVRLDLLAEHRQSDRAVLQHGVVEGLDVEPRAQLLLRLVPQTQDLQLA